jgi:ATP-dependent protease HslVU (ClpYQ) peptidase subunit
MNPAFQTFAEQSNKAVLFAPKGTVQRLDELMKELVHLAVETAKTLERGQLHEEFARHVDSLALSLSRFVFELAQELRTELGLEKIELSDIQKSALEKR